MKMLIDQKETLIMTYSDDYVTVVDDVCDPNVIQAIKVQYNNNLNAFYADDKDWGNSKLQKHPGLRGRQIIAGKHKEADYPSGHIIDKLIHAVLEKIDFEWGWVRVDERLYTPGSEMSWHCDGAHLAGAATLYLNDYWHTDWGGEFIYAKKNLEVHPQWQPFMLETDDYANEVAINNELGCVYPKFNRLVITNGDVMHKINRIDERAKARYALQFHFHYETEMIATKASSFLDD
jgi:hypothetical protein